MLLFQIIAISVFSQNCSIEGTVSDKQTQETLVGATIMIQGTTKGTITDFDGNFKINNLASGMYNLVISFVSYDPQILTVDLRNKTSERFNVQLSPATLNIGEINIKGRKRENTEVSLLSSLKTQQLIANGITEQQISKSQDKDAAEVVRRVPGITITNGRFVIVRGLIERYNSVMLNNATAPSFEADKRAFSFDAIPSSMIKNILIYKSPAPELPADFAGAAINIETKDVADENSLILSYSIRIMQRIKEGKPIGWAGTIKPVRFLKAYQLQQNSTNYTTGKMASTHFLKEQKKLQNLFSLPLSNHQR